MVVMESEEIKNQKVYVSPRPPPKISFKDNWMKELGSKIAGGVKTPNKSKPRSIIQLSSTMRPVSGQKFTKRNRERYLVHEDVKHSTRTMIPVCRVEFTQSFVLMPGKIEEEQTRMERPVKVEEHDIDFRVPRLSHSVVKEAKHLRFQELVKKIENQPHREALHVDLQQNNVYSPFSTNSKEMIRELGNV